jgi:DNA-binding transcriptional LysR family regulator
MATPDLNLLLALDVLLSEGSVAKAARRLQLSPSATSRALSRLREATGDPLLVKAGRGLVPTPRAEALRAQARHLVEAAQKLLRPVEQHDLSRLVRTFSLRTSDGFVEGFGPQLLDRVHGQAPDVRLNFLQKPEKESGALREGRVDLETGVVDGKLGPEIRTQSLFRDRLIGAVRADHPLARSDPSAASYLQARHVIVSRSGFDEGALDRPFLPEGLLRRVGSATSGFAAALALARHSDLVATVPELHTRALRTGMFSFALPIPTTEFTVSMLWHPRMDADPAHRWLRGLLREVCATSV